LYGAIVSTLLNAGWGSGAYQVGILSFLGLMLIGVALLRDVPEPPDLIPTEPVIPPLAPPARLAPAAAPTRPGDQSA
jgi:hypothetical protein